MAKLESFVDIDSFEQVEFPPRNEYVTSEATDFTPSRTAPLSLESFQQFLDKEGRLIEEHGLRQAVFKGGVDPSIRRQVWQFVFGLYPCMTTQRERDVLLQDYEIRYETLKDKWKKKLVLGANSVDPEEVGITASYISNLPLDLASPPPQQCSSSPVDAQQRDYFDIQAKIFAERQPLTPMKELLEYVRVIDRDVPRTDRDYETIREGGSHTLNSLRDMLITYAAFHPDIGYTQGMNDIVCRFLVVFGSEVEAYWCFNEYMAKIQLEFLEEGMIEKVDLMRQLLIELDPELFRYLDEQCEVGDLMFSHKWLLLGFKREFDFDNSLRCFEILSSHHLELSSMAAEQVRLKEIRKDYETQGGKTRPVAVTSRAEFTFELFMCVAILMDHRNRLFQCDDPSTVFQCISSLSKNMDLDLVLNQAERLFFKYCRKSVTDCFQVINTPLVKKKKTKTLLSFLP
ncbi:TBC1 domain family member 16-like [Lineus longissimus]|uniref:TBC1 domain family member 16-like n=1 Tax=Lineus longissimus TaxID=88925 RepID=UPI002B4E7664